MSQIHVGQICVMAYRRATLTFDPGSDEQLVELHILSAASVVKRGHQHTDHTLLFWCIWWRYWLSQRTGTKSFKTCSVHVSLRDAVIKAFCRDYVLRAVVLGRCCSEGLHSDRVDSARRSSNFLFGQHIDPVWRCCLCVTAHVFLPPTQAVVE